MKPAILALCVIGVALLSSAEANAQGVAFGVPVYAGPVYPTAVYPTAVYPTTVYAAPAYPTTTVYYQAPAAVYAAPAPYVATAPVVVGAPYRVYGYWGRHHAHFYYRW